MCDLIGNNDANGFVQGQHEEESPAKAVPPGSTTVEWKISGAGSPKKTDLAEVMFYAKGGDSPADADPDPDDLFFIEGATRTDIDGDFHVDFELNQVAANDCGDTDALTTCQPRSANDVILSYDTTTAWATSWWPFSSTRRRPGPWRELCNQQCEDRHPARLLCARNRRQRYPVLQRHRGQCWHLGFDGL